MISLLHLPGSALAFESKIIQFVNKKWSIDSNSPSFNLASTGSIKMPDAPAVTFHNKDSGNRLDLHVDRWKAVHQLVQFIYSQDEFLNLDARLNVIPPQPSIAFAWIHGYVYVPVPRSIDQFELCTVQFNEDHCCTFQLVEFKQDRVAKAGDLALMLSFSASTFKCQVLTYLMDEETAFPKLDVLTNVPAIWLHLIHPEIHTKKHRIFVTKALSTAIVCKKHISSDGHTDTCLTIFPKFFSPLGRSLD